MRGRWSENCQDVGVSVDLDAVFCFIIQTHINEPARESCGCPTICRRQANLERRTWKYGVLSPGVNMGCCM